MCDFVVPEDEDDAHHSEDDQYYECHAPVNGEVNLSLNCKQSQRYDDKGGDASSHHDHIGV